jgi:hypothetical protein
MQAYADVYVGGEGEDADEVLVDIHTTRMQAYADVCCRIRRRRGGGRG